MITKEKLGALVRVRSVELLDGFKVRVLFADETQKVIDLGQYLQGPIFEPIRNEPAVFRSVHVIGSTIGWDNGADIDPDVLYYGQTPAWQDTETASAIR